MLLVIIYSELYFPSEIATGVYEMHSPQAPTVEVMKILLDRTMDSIPAR